MNDVNIYTIKGYVFSTSFNKLYVTLNDAFLNTYLLIYNLKTGERLAELNLPELTSDIDLSLDGQFLYNTVYQHVYVRYASTGELIQEVPMVYPREPYEDLNLFNDFMVISPDGKKGYTGPLPGFAGTIAILDLETLIFSDLVWPYGPRNPCLICIVPKK